MAADHGWPMVKLGDVLNQIKETERFTDTANEKFVTVRLRGLGAVEREITTGKTPAPFNGFRIRTGQFIFSRIDARNGAFAIVPESLDGAAVSRDFPVFEIDSDQCDTGYLRHLLRSGRLTHFAQSVSFGATNRQRTKEEELLRCPIPLPPLPEQRRIAKILDASKAAITKLKYSQEQLLPIAFSLLERAQTDTTSTLSDYIEDISSGRNVADAKVPHPQRKVLRVSAVTTGLFSPHEAKPLPDSYDPPENHEALPGDVLVSRANTTELIGASAVVPPGVEDLYLPDKIWRVLPKVGVDPYFLWGILNTKTIRARISQRSTGSSGSMKNISQKNFLNVPCSSITETRAGDLARVPKAALKMLRLSEQKLSLLEELHTSLSARAFAGKL